MSDNPFDASKAILDFSSIMERAFNDLTKVLSDLPKTRIEKFIDSLFSRRAIYGIYLIYSPSKDLLYVGVSKNVSSRLRSHLNLTAIHSLLKYVCKSRNVNVEKLYGHRCHCGRMIECRNGKRRIPTNGTRAAKIASSILRNYLVSILRIDHGIEEHREIFERYVQMILRPKYGFEFNS